MLVQEVNDFFILTVAYEGIKTDLFPRTFFSEFYGGYKQSSAAPTADPTMVHVDLGNVAHVSRKTDDARHGTCSLSLLNWHIIGPMLARFS